LSLRQPDSPHYVRIARVGANAIKGRIDEDPIELIVNSRSELCTLSKLSRSYTPTGNGLVCAGLDDTPANLPCNSDINPVYQ
jgi:hypothetical protein